MYKQTLNSTSNHRSHTFQVVHPLEVIIEHEDVVQLSVVVLPLLLLMRRGLSRHLLVDFPVCQILLLLEDIDEAPNGRITAAHETPKTVVPSFSVIKRSRKAGQYVVVLIQHPWGEEGRGRVCANPCPLVVICKGLHLGRKGRFLAPARFRRRLLGV